MTACLTNANHLHIHYSSVPDLLRCKPLNSLHNLDDQLKKLSQEMELFCLFFEPSHFIMVTTSSFVWLADNSTSPRFYEKHINYYTNKCVSSEFLFKFFKETYFFYKTIISRMTAFYFFMDIIYHLNNVN